ncbi:MAG: ABC transporter substrate-binding protein [Opitutaceae bacterium]
MNIVLRGITWEHTRGYSPLVATAQSYREFHPGVEVVWDQRSFRSFGEEPLARFAGDYDLVVFDHPFTGDAAAQGLLVPLDENLPGDYLADQRAQSVGHSCASYMHEGRQVGLVIDAAVQLASWRADLMSAGGHAVPRSWDEVVALGLQTGRVRVPLAPMGAMGVFFSLCAGLGEPAGRGAGPFISRVTGLGALEMLDRLFQISGPDSLQLGVVALLSRLATTDDLLYAPCQYGYNNFARDGFVPHPLSFGPIPQFDPRRVGGANLGGAGLGIFTASRHRTAALNYLQWVLGEPVQRTLYTHSGGQPGYRRAWLDEINNEITHGFFRTTLPEHDAAYCRPTHPAFPQFQSTGGQLLHAFLRQERAAIDVIAMLNRLYQDSLPETPNTE